MTNVKPPKPTPDFPLFPHASGRWAKKINGQFKYFGPWADPDAALQRYREFVDGESSKVQAKRATDKGPKPAKPEGSPLFPHAVGQWAAKIGGRTKYFGPWSDHAAALERYNSRDTTPDTTPGGKVRQTGRPNIVTLVNKFLSRCDRKVAAGELTTPLREAYDTVCTWTMKVLGKYTLVESLGPDNFAKLRRAFAKGQRGEGVSAVTLTNYVTHARTMFNYSAKVLNHRVNYGDEFSRPNRKILRRERRARPKKFFEANEIHRLMAAASPQLKAMMLLGVNCGFGNADCARLKLDHVNLETGWAVFPRPKTEVDRRAPLWPETIAAITAAMAVRPEPAKPEHANHIFLTKQGNTWESKNPKGGDSPVSNEVGKLKKALKIDRKGAGFYAMRHVTETVGKQLFPPDQEALDYILGHGEASDDMGAVYNELAPSDERLKRVSDHIRGWLFSDSIQSLQDEAA